jgi:hypothetical protein
MISMKDYEGYHGFGQIAQVEVDELSKALSAGYQNPPVSGSNALRVESLEQTLRVLTFTQAHIQFWRDIPKLPAFSTVEEYNVQTSYGSEGGMFTRAGELPQVQDASYERRTALVKYVTTQREVDHPTTLVRPAHGNVIAQETQNGGIWILERVERALYNGNSAIIAEAWDGIDTQIRNDPQAATTSIIDLRGGILTEDNIEDATNRVIENYGVPTDLYAAPKALSSMVKQFYPRERFSMPAPVDGIVGMSVNRVRTQAGLINLKGNIFLRSGKNNSVKNAPASANSVRAPVVPSQTSANVAGPFAASLFGLSDVGVWRYRVTSINRFGESAASASTTASIAAAGDDILITITNNADSSDVTTGYNIYRCPVVGGVAGTEQFMVQVPRVAGAATTAFTDTNRFLPNTSHAYLKQMNLQGLSFRQLAPMMKIPLATIALSIRWAMLLYGMPIIYATRKFVIFDNVGDE